MVEEATVSNEKEKKRNVSTSAKPSASFYPVDLSNVSLNDPTLEIDPERLRKSRKFLGEGLYGEVWQGILRSGNAISQSKNSEETVAIKYPKLTGPKEQQEAEKKAIWNEIKILAHIGRHDNVVQLKGAVTSGDRIWMVLELCENGSLKKLLTKISKQRDSGGNLFVNEIVRDRDPLKVESNTVYRLSQDPTGWRAEFQRLQSTRKLTTSDLHSFALQLASGMEYLHSKGIVHRDLALRNLLLDAFYVVKIADFGLSRFLPNGYYRKKNVELEGCPIYWTAPEVLDSVVEKVQPESDLWTFGVVLWELYGLAHGIPYIDVPESELLFEMKNGKRLSRPQYAPIEIYVMMQSLWNLDQYRRPSLTACGKIIENQLRLSCPEMINAKFCNGKIYYKPFTLVNHQVQDSVEYKPFTYVGQQSVDSTVDTFRISSSNGSADHQPFVENSIVQALQLAEDSARPERQRRKCFRFWVPIASVGIVSAVVLVLAVIMIIAKTTSEQKQSQTTDSQLTMVETTLKTSSNPVTSTTTSMDVPQTKASKQWTIYDYSRRAEFNGREYLYVIWPVKWDEAEENCISVWGGHHVSIHSKEEHENITNIHKDAYTRDKPLEGSIWIGLTDQGHEGTFIWSDGTPTDYLHWDWSQPNNHNGNENCGTNTHKATFNDEQCYTIYKYICQRDRNNHTPITDPDGTNAYY